jgi:hypothetical protein
VLGVLIAWMRDTGRCAGVDRFMPFSRALTLQADAAKQQQLAARLQAESGHQGAIPLSPIAEGSEEGSGCEGSAQGGGSEQYGSWGAKGWAVCELLQDEECLKVLRILSHHRFVLVSALGPGAWMGAGPFGVSTCPVSCNSNRDSNVVYWGRHGPLTWACLCPPFHNFLLSPSLTGCFLCRRLACDPTGSWVLNVRKLEAAGTWAAAVDALEAAFCLSFSRSSPHSYPHNLSVPQACL